MDSLNNIYNKASLTLKAYGEQEPDLASFDTVYFLDKNYIKSGYSILDIGGATGCLLEAINKEIAPIKGTIIDPDEKSIKYGKEKYPHFEFIQAGFPHDFADRKFDVVFMQALFPQIPNWKEVLLSMQKCARKYINFSCILKLEGTTVVDKDVSYVYCLDSGERLYQVVHNINEIINFLCIHEMRVKSIKFWGSCSSLCLNKTPIVSLIDSLNEDIVITPALWLLRSGDAFRSTPGKFEIKGSFLLELFDENENPKRYGGWGDREKTKGYDFFEPEKDVRFFVYNDVIAMQRET